MDDDDVCAVAGTGGVWDVRVAEVNGVVGEDIEVPIRIPRQGAAEVARVLPPVVVANALDPVRRVAIRVFGCEGKPDPRVRPECSERAGELV